MRRRLFNVCSAVSLLLLVAVCGLWVRTRGHSVDRLERYEPLWGWGLYLQHGRLSCSWYVSDGGGEMDPMPLRHGRFRTPGNFHPSHPGTETDISFGGVRYAHAVPWPGWHNRALTVPLWLPAAAFAVMPALAAASWRRRRRRARRLRAGSVARAATT